MLFKSFFLNFLGFFIVYQAQAEVFDFSRYFRVDMNMEIPDIREYARKLKKKNAVYDKGYVSRFRMGTVFNKSFSKIIKHYGMSEGRIKAHYEDNLLEMISWMPKESYQYIGPVLHQVPGMSEKILNLPGIKETKNQFPKDVAEKFKGMEGLEYLSPSLYFALMPSVWGEEPLTTPDTPKSRPAKRPVPDSELPDFLKEKIGLPVKVAEKTNASARRKASMAQKLGLKTLNPDITSPLTSKDVEDYIASIDLITSWAKQDNMRNYSKLIHAEILLNQWEREHGEALPQNELKDIVNPCQRVVLKTRFAGLYGEFSMLTAQKGFTPEGWAYTCDKTIKAFRVTDIDYNEAHAVHLHRRGYLHTYIDKLPQKLRLQMYILEEAVSRMYRVFKEDVETVRPYRDELRQKFIENDNMLLTSPIFY